MSVRAATVRRRGAAQPPERTYELLIFDWDGTLADSVKQIVRSMQLAITALRLPPRSDEQIAELIGLGFAEGLARLYPTYDSRRLLLLLAAYRARAPTIAYSAPLFAGVGETLAALRAQGYRLAIATGKTRSGLERSLESFPHLQPLFVTTRCADETADKPDPCMLREILAETGVRTEAALMIGDTEYDMAMAAALGMPALGVACGVHEAGRLLKAGARAVVDDVRAVPAWLGSLPEGSTSRLHGKG